ncbi:hypothetical protein KW076_06695 [Micrococcus porci]|uniref:hypothetical protein n=1 Tax=Micrococcus TaxID=1269 RepID=UPI001CCB415F|nr:MULTISPECIES: hypothetical protein [Micrococcus]MCG7422471.1 hypothetical protein [Micrococcus sp. ACRRV]UBH23597.1 hypothetical protein KW076_06695 [Micrococcus porci]
MPEASDDVGAVRVAALGGAPWRGTDAAEAQLATLGELGAEHWPVLPELPDRGPGADATGRSAALLHELAVDLQPHGWRVSPPGVVGSGMDRRRAASFWREDAHRWADTAGAEGAVVERLGVRLRGPLSLLGSLWLPGGERVLVDHGARRDVAASYVEGLRDAVPRLAAATGARTLGVVLDEPWAAAVLAGALPTASGYRTVRSVPRDEVRALWRDALAALADLPGVGRVWLAPGRRSAGVDVPLPDVSALAALAGESLPAAAPSADDDAPAPTRVDLVVPVGALDPGPDGTGGTRAGWETAAGWTDAGRGLTLSTATGVRPADVARTWERLGADPGHLAGVGLTVPGPHDAAVLGRLRADAEELAARVGELLG